MVLDLTFQTGFFVLLTCPHHSVSTSSLFDTRRCSRFIWYFPCSWNQPFLQGTLLCFLFLFVFSAEWHIEMTIWGLDTLIATGVSFVYIHVDNQPLSLFLSAPPSLLPFLPLSFFKTMSSHLYFQFWSNTTRTLSPPPLLNFAALFSNSEKAWLQLPTVYLFIYLFFYFLFF